MITPIDVPRYGRVLMQPRQRNNIRIAEWLIGDGEAIESGEPLVVLETSKASFELVASASGLVFRLKQANEKVKLGETIGVTAGSVEEFNDYLVSARN